MWEPVALEEVGLHLYSVFEWKYNTVLSAIKKKCVYD